MAFVINDWFFISLVLIVSQLLHKEQELSTNTILLSLFGFDNKHLH